MEQSPEKNRFQPFQVMGYFWAVLGVVVLLAAFTIKGSELVPAVRGIVTNIIAGSLLLVIGALSILRGRAEKKRSLKS